MALDPVVNFGKVIVADPYDQNAVSVQLNAGQAALLPNPSTQGAFNVVWYNDTDFPDPADDPNREICRVTGESTDLLTLLRAQEGTIATTKNIGGKTYKMILAVTAKTISDIQTALPNFASEEKVSGSGTSWVLANTPVAGSVHLYIKGSRSTVQAGDYTISGKNITTALSWSFGDVIADYRY